MTLERKIQDALVELGLPLKARFGSPCNQCGLCCTIQLCEAAKIAFSGVTAPCPALGMEEGKTICLLVKTEIENKMEPYLQKVLGIGHGCSMTDEAKDVRFHDPS